MKLILSVLLFLNVLVANENLKSIYENIVLKNSKDAVLTSQKLKKSIELSKTKESKLLFSELVKAWKKVEAFYILGDLNDDYIDTPRYIDIFNQGKEDIKKQLDFILSGTEEPKFALYKNSHKTINALEYILFTKSLKEPRIQQSALLVVSRIESNLEEIYEGYVAEQGTFLKDEVTSNAIMLNSLIENSYKIKEWRVGNPAGLSRKYKGKPDNARSEYFVSKNSIVAIEAILHTHQMVLAKQSYKNFGTMIGGYGVTEELNTALKYLEVSLEKSKEIKGDDFTEGKPLFKSLKKLHATYYITLIGKLKITAKILDADGD